MHSVPSEHQAHIKMYHPENHPDYYHPENHTDYHHRQRQIYRADNLMYNDGADDAEDRYSLQQPALPEPDYDAGAAFDYGSNIDSSPMEYDYAMEELLRQLPSRQLEDVAETASRTLWRKRIGSSRRGTMRIHKDDALENHIIQTIQSDLEDVDQVYDDLDAAVRTIPTTLSRKRNIRRRLSVKKRRNLKRSKLIKYWFSTKWQQMKYKLKQEMRLFGLWRSHLKIIEGCFGTSVVSYFIFLKWVLLINIPIFLLTFSFLVIPQILYRYYAKVPAGYADNKNDFTGIELLTGTGFFKDSEMYYGFYTSRIVEVFGEKRYDMKHAYILTCIGYYLFCVIILGYSYLRSYRKYYIEVSGSVRQYYFSLMFCGWDYGITSQETGQLKHRSIYNEFKEYLAGMNTVKEILTRGKIARKWLVRLLVWTVVLALLGASGYVTYVVSTELSVKDSQGNSTTEVPAINSLVMPFVISSMQLIIPMVFSFLEAYEQFSMPKYELYVHMFREQLLRAAMLGVLVYFWLHQSSSKCWETFVGQEIYRLTIMDMIFGLVYTFFMEFIRKICSWKWKLIKRAEFAIARHTLELIYTQSLCWLGIFYSPLLSVVVIVKLVITFYVKRYSVIYNCRPSLKPWRASKTHTIFVGYIFVFFIFSCVAVFFSILQVQPSTVCGPYQNYTTSYDVIIELVADWEKRYQDFGVVLKFISSPGFISGVLVLLCMILYYMRTVTISRKKRVEQFKTQLILEGKDKQFLLNLLNQVKLSGGMAYAKAGPSIPRAVQQQISQERPAFF